MPCSAARRARRQVEPERCLAGARARDATRGDNRRFAEAFLPLGCNAPGRNASNRDHAVSFRPECSEHRALSATSRHHRRLFLGSRTRATSSRELALALSLGHSLNSNPNLDPNQAVYGGNGGGGGGASGREEEFVRSARRAGPLEEFQEEAVLARRRRARAGQVLRRLLSPPIPQPTLVIHVAGLRCRTLTRKVSCKCLVIYLRAGGVPTRHTHRSDGLHTRYPLERTHTNTHKHIAHVIPRAKALVISPGQTSRELPLGKGASTS